MSSTPPTALLTGITGQDGSYLTELLLAKGYVVHGLVRRASMFNRSRIEHLRQDRDLYGKRLFLHYADLQDTTTLRRLIHSLRPRELYHFAGQSHVGLSFEIPESTCEEVGMGTLALLEICRDLDYPIRLYYASSSEIFGTPEPGEVPQTERTPFRPQSPYACAKAFSTHLCRVYRQAYSLFVCSGMTYNHESPRRGESFVTRKITSSAARIRRGTPEVLRLGNLDAARDWGYAPEYVDAMWRMLQQEVPDDYVVATGRASSVRDFVRAAFESLSLPLDFEGEGLHEVGRDHATGQIRVEVHEPFFRPVEPTHLVGDSSHALAQLGWSAHTHARALAGLMATADWAALSATQTALADS